jgi:hypothetical protein
MSRFGSIDVVVVMLILYYADFMRSSNHCYTFILVDLGLPVFEREHYYKIDGKWQDISQLGTTVPYEPWHFDMLAKRTARKQIG